MIRTLVRSHRLRFTEGNRVELFDVGHRGLDAMRALRDEGFEIHVYDRHTPLTDIIDMALEKKA